VLRQTPQSTEPFLRHSQHSFTSDGKLHLRSTVAIATLAQLDITCEFLEPRLLYSKKFPPLVECLLHNCWNIDDCVDWHKLIRSFDVSIVELIEPKCVPTSAEFVKVLYLRTMVDSTFPSQRSDWRLVRLHGGVEITWVDVVLLNVLWSVEPVDQHRDDRRSRVRRVCMSKLHDTTKVVRFAWRLTDEVGIV